MSKRLNGKNFTTDFIINYKAAIKARLTREEFAKLLDIKAESLIRRRLAIKKETGLDLVILPSVPPSADTDLKQEKLDAYNASVLEQTQKSLPKATSPNIQSKKIYVITSAQNATPVHEGFLTNLLNYCDVRDAQLLVIPYRYKNATSIWNSNNEKDEWWHQTITPYLCSDDLRLGKQIRILGNIPIQPTAAAPLTGFDSYTGGDSAIFGHPKVQLRTVATPANHLPKILASTGSITLPNYVDSKTGHIASFHHSFSAVIVELDKDDIFHLRHIHADEVTGAFYDLNKLYSDGTVEDVERIAALVTGDTHAEFIDENVLNATYLDSNSIVSVLNPECQIFHDLIDFYSRSHHHNNGNEVLSIGKHRYGRNSVEEGLQIAANFIDTVSRPDIWNIIVKSNHDEAFDKWLNIADPKIDPENAQFYYWMKYNQAKHIKMTDTGFDSIDPFEFWCKYPDQFPGLKNTSKTKFLKRSESFRVNGIELGFHGDMGANGSRGSAKQYARLGNKNIIGHSHSPQIYEGCYQVGVSAKLNLEYSKNSPSSWLHTHCIVYPDGKRTLINIISGKWKL